MTWFMSEAWERYGGGILALIATAYAGCFVQLGRRLRREAALQVPGGILYTLAVGMTPVAIWGFQHDAGIWVPEGHDPGAWFHLEPQRCRLIMEAGTILAGALVLRLTRYPLALTPVIIAAGAMALDLTMVALGQTELTDVQVQWVLVCCGLAVLALS